PAEISVEHGYFESGNPPGVLENNLPGGLPDIFMPLRGKNLRVMTLFSRRGGKGLNNLRN
ncbi:MAG: hypothetical protein QM537_07115, partial [Candidatus Symbiobacter sp.]|nr:hypothetical protein [Candidatus Symbiobacter sp.]